MPPPAYLLICNIRFIMESAYIGLRIDFITIHILSLYDFRYILIAIGFILL